MSSYYAVCNVNGPISVLLNAVDEQQALAAFAAMDGRAAIDSMSTDAEDDLDIDGADMTEDAFADALQAAGAECVHDLTPVHGYHSGRTAHLRGGWMLWRVD